MAERYGRRAGAGLIVGMASVTAACGLLDAGEPVGGSEASAEEVAMVAGFTRIATTPNYVVVVNVLPAEEMFTQQHAEQHHPIEGELIVDGDGLPVGAEVRHVEAHIYHRSTGLPAVDLDPRLAVLNRTTGERTDVPATLMQDVNIGEADLHYGNNVHIPGGSAVNVTVTVGNEEVSIDGLLE
jgi:hypothetical protein